MFYCRERIRPFRKRNATQGVPYKRFTSFYINPVKIIKVKVKKELKHIISSSFEFLWNTTRFPGPIRNL